MKLDITNLVSQTHQRNIQHYWSKILSYAMQFSKKINHSHESQLNCLLYPQCLLCSSQNYMDFIPVIFLLHLCVIMSFGSDMFFKQHLRDLSDLPTCNSLSIR